MAKNDDDIVKKYAAETRGMPPNLARIAARNLARTDASIAKVDAIRNRGVNELPGDVIAQRYGDPGGSTLQGKESGYYDSKGRYLGPLGSAAPKGATGIVGAAAASGPTTDPATARQAGFSGAATAFAAKPAGQRTAYERSFLSGYDVPGVVQAGDPGLGFQAGSFLRGAGSFLGRVGRGGLGGLVSPLFPAVRSFLDQFSSRPRPYTPFQRAPLTGASPSPTPAPRTASNNNPYYDFNP